MRGDRRKKIFPLILSVFLIGTIKPVYSADIRCDSEIKSESERVKDVKDETEVLSEDEIKSSGEVTGETGKEQEADEPAVPEEEVPEEQVIPPETIEDQNQSEPEEIEKFCHDHNERCGFTEAQEEIPCDRNCSQKDMDGNIIHSEGCAYRPAAEAHPCKYEVEVRKKRDGLEADEAILNELQEEIEAKKAEEEKRLQEEAEKVKEQPQQAETSESPESKTDETEKLEETKKLKGLSNLSGEHLGKTDEAEGKDTGKEEKDETAADTEHKFPEVPAEQISEPEEKKNEAMFYVSVPSSVTLTGDTDSFDIETSREVDLPDGNVLITVEGTESCDDESFALYHENDMGIIWRYRLQIAGQMVDKIHNEVVIPGAETIQKAVIVPTDSYDKMLPGLYSGSITFHVEYQESEQK